MTFSHIYSSSDTIGIHNFSILLAYLLNNVSTGETSEPSLSGCNTGEPFVYEEANYSEGSIIDQIVLLCDGELTDTLTPC